MESPVINVKLVLLLLLLLLLLFPSTAGKEITVIIKGRGFYFSA